MEVCNNITDNNTTDNNTTDNHTTDNNITDNSATDNNTDIIGLAILCYVPQTLLKKKLSNKDALSSKLNLEGVKTEPVTHTYRLIL